MARVVEATAPCRVDLAGGGPGASVLAVAIDRRVSCRVETGPSGVELESRDTLRKASAPDLNAVGEVPSLGLAVEVLRALDVRTGLRVTTQTRLADGTGLGDAGALAVALTGAVARALGRDLSSDDVLRVAAEAARHAARDAPAAGAEAAAVHGGIVAVEHGAAAGAEVLPVDPARVEESLLLVDTGRAARSVPPVSRDATDAVRAALLAGRLEEILDLWAEDWKAGREGVAGWPPPEAGRVTDVVLAAGGATRLCGVGRGRVLAVWAPPGPRGAGRREAVQAALRSCGVRLFAGRVDLRGLDVECEEPGYNKGFGEVAKE